MYREIVTRAVIGKGKISNNGEVIVKPSNSVSKVLGCWVINHYYVSSFENNKVFAKGRYDIHVWYGFNNDSETSVHKQTVDYIEEFSLRLKDNETIDENSEYIIKCVKYPTCGSLELNDEGNIIVNVEKELILDVIGETKLKVQISGVSDDEWDLSNEDINSINVDYLNRG